MGDRVFVKVDVSEPVSTGGILLPTSAQKKPTQGEVVSLGDAKSLKVTLNPGILTTRMHSMVDAAVRTTRSLLG